VRVVTKYIAEDGAEFRTAEECVQHEQLVERVYRANLMLEEGRSLLECLEAAGFHVASDNRPILAQIAKDTGLSISHWQCRDEPGYKPQYLTIKGTVYVWGNAGSWSGPYGGLCSQEDVVRYWKETYKVKP